MSIWMGVYDQTINNPTHKKQGVSELIHNSYRDSESLLTGEHWLPVVYS